ncbi:protein ORF13 [Lake sturgeon herpesvirus]|nr:protein ORF13 [Lake sturgeon herpesvirus]
MDHYVNCCWDLHMGLICSQTVSLHKTVKSLLYGLTPCHYVFGDTQLNLNTPAGHWMINVCPPTLYGAIKGIDFHVRLAAGVMELHMGQCEKQLLSIYPIERHGVVNLWYALSQFYLADSQKIDSLTKVRHVSAGCLNKLKMGRYHKLDGRYYLIQQFYQMTQTDSQIEPLIEMMLQYIHHPKDVAHASDNILIFNSLMLQAEHVVVVDTSNGLMFCDVAFITNGGNMCSVSLKIVSNGVELWYKPLFSNQKALLDHFKINIHKCMDKNVVADPSIVYKEPVVNDCLRGVFVVGVNTESLNKQIIKYRQESKRQAQMTRQKQVQQPLLTPPLIPLSQQQEKRKCLKEHQHRRLSSLYKNDVDMV